MDLPQSIFHSFYDWEWKLKKERIQILIWHFVPDWFSYWQNYAFKNHKTSSLKHSRHFLCPEDANSWCKFQQTISTNALESFVDKPGLSEDVATNLFPIYEDLLDPKLLQRCAGGFTRNNNECFNSLIWQIALKSNFNSSIML
ncbi:uncharacterized protein LOC118440448 [Vespa mandarinia]|uniref:uncharacterized protein LOC118440448 n=1 Tax=Vespa mandarinia TaxID=7446 RepID=UPI0016074B0A|nr:uncharacterized protein LOC118440448 [Vespa mandarinia]